MQLTNDWKVLLKDELEKEYYKKMIVFLEEEYKTKAIYPKKEDVFNAFKFTAYKDVKVVIIGQDPYHQKGQAHGLSFSVQHNIKTPKSLNNIYKELKTDLNCFMPDNGNLEKWARQGVLLLNATLTVEDSKPNSHKDIGWASFTKKVIELLNQKKEPIIFLLWGNFAKDFKSLIDTNKHFVLEAPHPSPYSASNGFFGCKHFSKANALLKLQGKQSIDWQIEPIYTTMFLKELN